MHDFARGAVAEGRHLIGLAHGQIGQHALGQGRIQPQHLPGGDDPIAAEGRGKPGDARVGVEAGGQHGGEHRDIRARLFQPCAKRPIGGAQLGAFVLDLAYRAMRLGDRALETVPRRPLVLAGAGFQKQVHPPPRRQGEHEIGSRGRQTPWRLGERHAAGPSATIQALIGEGHSTAGEPWLIGQPPGRTLEAPDLEDVAKIGAIFEGDGQHDLVEAEVGQAQTLEQMAVVQTSLSLDVDDTARRCAPAHGRQGEIGPVEGEHGVVAGQAEAQFRWTLVADQEA